MKRWMLLLLCLALTLTGAAALAAETETETETAVLGDDVYGFQIELEGQVLTLPMRFEDMVSAGWTFQGDPETTLAPRQYDSATWKRNDARITVYHINLDIDVMTLPQCLVAGINVTDTDLKGMAAVLPGGLEVGKATPEDVEAAYGTPSDLYEGSSITYTYNLDSYQEVKLTFNAETKLLTGAYIRNYVNPFEIDYSKVSDEVPAKVQAYVAPTELGEDLLSFVFEYGGALYQLPAPYAAFAADGWQLNGDLEEVVAANDTSTFHDMRKNNQTLSSLLLKNPEDKATYVTNCWVTKAVNNVNTTGIELVLPKDIKLGSTKEEMEAAYADLEPEITDSSTYWNYRYGDINARVDIVVNKESGEVTGIEINRTPKSAEY